MAKGLKVGKHRGDGPPPGYRWNLVILDLAFSEAMKFLDESQYRHLSELFWQLAGQGDPTHSLTISVRAIEDLMELRDKGGILHGLNVRIFYYVDKRDGHRSIVIVGAIVKKNDGATLEVEKIRMRRRLRKYLRGDYGIAAVEANRVGSGKKGASG